MKAISALLITGFCLASIIMSGCATAPKPVRHVVINLSPATAKAEIFGTLSIRSQIIDSGTYQFPLSSRREAIRMNVFAPDCEPQMVTLEPGMDSITVHLKTDEEMAREHAERKHAEEIARRESIEQELKALRLTEAEKQLIRENKVSVGMPPEAIILVYGRPDWRSKSDGIGASSEVISYSLITFYFVNGRLVRWTELTN